LFCLKTHRCTLARLEGSDIRNRPPISCGITRFRTSGKAAPSARRPVVRHAAEDVSIAHDFLHERGIEADSKIRYGDPADELIAEATEGRCDGGVAGSRGYGPVGQLLHGSVSRKLVKEMPCPVIVAGPEGTERHEPEVRARSQRD
jgi:nucleotide-binding universal stress UspA family protein